MRRTIASLQTWWIRLFVAGVLVVTLLSRFADIRVWWDLPLLVLVFALSFARVPDAAAAPIELAAPLRGTWVAINSPGTAVPSHGVKSMGQKYAVDVLQPEPQASARVGWGLRPRRPRTFRSFGQPVRAMAAGTVLRATDVRRDHGSRDTWPLLIWMLTVEGFLRELRGVGGIYGNHLLIRHDDGTVAAYAHLRHDSAAVRAGDSVAAGQPIGQVGNTGNTSEPHLHVHLMNDQRPSAAAGIAMLWRDIEVDPAEVDPRWGDGSVKQNALAGFPPNGQIFHVGESGAAGSGRSTGPTVSSTSTGTPGAPAPDQV